MKQRVTLRFRDRPSPTSIEGPTLGDAVSAGGRATVEVVPEMSPRDEVIFLLHTAAEIEHALMVQYLYAAWSLPTDAPPLVARWRRDVLQVAREEMAHFAAVQNLLRFVGGPLNFDREDFPYRTDFYPFPFGLEPLSRNSLARFVAAEMPAEPDVDPTLVEEAVALATGLGGGHPVNRVGALYNRLTLLFADERQLSDSAFRPDSADAIQARPERYRADVGRGPLYLRTLRSRAEALALLADVASQGEGDQDTARSHFLIFIDMFDRWTRVNPTALDVPTNPSIARDGENSGRITHPRAAKWAGIFNQHYRMLLAWLQHALLTPSSATAGPGLSLRVFAEMLALSEVGQLLTTLPQAADGAPRAGAPFELPYTLAFPDLPGDRWDHHRDLLFEARSQIEDLEPDPADDPIRHHLLTSIAAAQGFLDTHAVQASA